MSMKVGIVSDILTSATCLLSAERLEDQLEPFLAIARWIPRGLSPYINLAAVIDAGISQEDENERYSIIIPCCDCY